MRENRSIILAIAALSFGLYMPAAVGGFSWDEYNLFFGESFFIKPVDFDYSRPLHISLLLLIKALFGDNAVVYHIVGSFIHFLNSLMVFLIAMRLFRSSTVSFISALIFALHPVNSEAVSWVYAGNELVKTFLMLVSIHIYLLYREDHKLSAIAASALFYLLACLAGQSALVLPLVLFLYETMLGDGPLGRKTAIAAYLLMAAVYLAAFYGNGEFVSMARAQSLSLSDALSALGYYSVKMVLPVGISMDPPLLSSPFYFISSLSLLIVPFLMIGRFRAETYLIMFITIMLMPPVLLAMTGWPDPVGIKYLYTPSVGFSMLVAVLVSRIPSRKALVVLVTLIALLYSAGSLDRAVVWGDRVELWKDSVSKNRNSVPHKINLAASLMMIDMNNEAMHYLKMALQNPRLSSSEFKRIMEMLYRVSPGNDKDMLALLSEAKGRARALLGMGFYYFDLYSNSGKADKALIAKAVNYLQKAVDEDQTLLLARFYLGIGYLETGQYEKSIEQLTAVKSMDTSAKYASDTEFYLGLAGKFRDLSGNQLQIKGSSKDKLRIDLK